MAIVVTDNKHYADIASAIREKTGNATTYKPEQMAEGIDAVYEAGNPLKYVTSEGAVDNLFYKSAFPEGYEFVVDMQTPPINLGSMFRFATGVRKITLKVPETQTYNTSYMFYQSSTAESYSLQEVVIDNDNDILKSSNFGRFVGYCRRLKSITGSIDLSDNTSTQYAFIGCGELEEVRFVEGTIKLGIDFSACSKLSDASITSIINGLSGDAVEQTLTVHPDVAKRIIEADVTDRGWSLAY